MPAGIYMIDQTRPKGLVRHSQVPTLNHEHVSEDIPFFIRNDRMTCHSNVINFFLKQGATFALGRATSPTSPKRFPLNKDAFRDQCQRHTVQHASRDRLSFCTELLLCDGHIYATLWYAKQFLGGKSIDSSSHLVLHNVQITHTHTHLHTHASAHVFHDNFPSICASCAGTVSSVCHKQGLSFSHMQA